MSTQDSIKAAAEDVSLFLPLFERILSLFGLVLHHTNAPEAAHVLLAEAHSAKAVLESAIAPTPTPDAPTNPTPATTT